MPGPPAPLRGGPVALLRFMWRNKMLRPSYARLLSRLAWYKLRFGKRLQLDGIAFIQAGAEIEIGPNGVLHLGRWSWLGRRTKIRVHEGVVEIGSKTVLGEGCNISAFQHLSIGRECVIADRVMMLDFDHRIADTDVPIRTQGIVKRDVRIGHNCWIGYGVSVLRGVTVGNNSVLGAGAVVTKDVAPDSIVGGVPARLLAKRDAPTTMTWNDELPSAPGAS